MKPSRYEGSELDSLGVVTTTHVCRLSMCIKCDELLLNCNIGICL